VTKAATKTPLRAALLTQSSLRPLVVNGIGAVEAAHRDYFEPGIRSTFSDSIDLDAALKKGHSQENRWDYLLGHLPSGQVVAVEPHSAKQDEITTLIKKRDAARQQLKDHLRDDVRIVKWLWVASGKVQFADTEKARRLLDQNGIEFVGTKVLEKHLPGHLTKAASRKNKR